MRSFKLVTFGAAAIVGGCLMTVFGFMQRDGEPIYPNDAVGMPEEDD